MPSTTSKGFGYFYCSLLHDSFWMMQNETRNQTWRVEISASACRYSVGIISLQMNMA